MIDAQVARIDDHPGYTITALNTGHPFAGEGCQRQDKTLNRLPAATRRPRAYIGPVIDPRTPALEAWIDELPSA
jgi:hypothetical protein